ncbi:MAG: hypothetical protein ABR903_00705 [Thermodesulfovibrionales bacterium]|jgi:hypothetical protein
MKIFYILKSAPDETIRKIIERQSQRNEMKLLVLDADEFSYERIVEDIFTYDKVISW